MQSRTRHKSRAYSELDFASFFVELRFGRTASFLLTGAFLLSTAFTAYFPFGAFEIAAGFFFPGSALLELDETFFACFGIEF